MASGEKLYVSDTDTELYKNMRAKNSQNYLGGDDGDLEMKNNHYFVF